MRLTLLLSSWRKINVITLPMPKVYISEMQSELSPSSHSSQTPVYSDHVCFMVFLAVTCPVLLMAHLISSIKCHHLPSIKLCWFVTGIRPRTTCARVATQQCPPENLTPDLQTAVRCATTGPPICTTTCEKMLPNMLI